MSYILDALKQSERKRGQQTSSAENHTPAETPSLPPAPRYRRRLGWLLAGVLLALIVGYGLGKIGSRWLQSPQQAISPQQTIEMPSPAATPPEPEEKAPAQAAPTAARTPIVTGPAPVRILLDDPPSLTMNPAPKAGNTTTPATESAGSSAKVSPDVVPTPEPVFDPGVPDLRELPASIRAKLPPLTLSVHIYSKTAGSRMASINGQMLREGQQLGALRLQSITPRGVILSFEGKEFHLKSVGG
ncbi:general secretion pathway protein GspB [uncultured Oceanisphaera sp.]|uniref:general secretion pathway protein GspB n=1 Tax=uncultured Oceanisphaera sp. TaxID=353858 RepID=UPI00262D7F0B|nr:general secretion pathway protein GspB [uncultured Oceanisphaera sp.]